MIVREDFSEIQESDLKPISKLIKIGSFEKIQNVSEALRVINFELLLKYIHILDNKTVMHLGKGAMLLMKKIADKLVKDFSNMRDKKLETVQTKEKIRAIKSETDDEEEINIDQTNRKQKSKKRQMEKDDFNQMESIPNSIMVNDILSNDNQFASLNKILERREQMEIETDIKLKSKSQGLDKIFNQSQMMEDNPSRRKSVLRDGASREKSNNNISLTFNNSRLASTGKKDRVDHNNLDAFDKSGFMDNDNPNAFSNFIKFNEKSLDERIAASNQKIFKQLAEDVPINNDDPNLVFSNRKNPFMDDDQDGLPIIDKSKSRIKIEIDESRLGVSNLQVQRKARMLLKDDNDTNNLSDTEMTGIDSTIEQTTITNISDSTEDILNKSRQQIKINCFLNRSRNELEIMKKELSILESNPQNSYLNLNMLYQNTSRQFINPNTSIMESFFMPKDKTNNNITIIKEEDEKDKEETSVLKIKDKSYLMNSGIESSKKLERFRHESTNKKSFEKINTSMNNLFENNHVVDKSTGNAYEFVQDRIQEEDTNYNPTSMNHNFHQPQFNEDIYNIDIENQGVREYRQDDFEQQELKFTKKHEELANLIYPLMNNYNDAASLFNSEIKDIDYMSGPEGFNLQTNKDKMACFFYNLVINASSTNSETYLIEQPRLFGLIKLKTIVNS